ncbi:MAG TPA: hypothetical protein PKL70_15475 [Saprospiraceae bacterium]|nr:hypothetical protein [Saprospiraceae bacterium]
MTLKIFPAGPLNVALPGMHESGGQPPEKISRLEDPKRMVLFFHKGALI